MGKNIFPEISGHTARCARFFRLLFIFLHMVLLGYIIAGVG